MLVVRCYLRFKFTTSANFENFQSRFPPPHRSGRPQGAHVVHEEEKEEEDEKAGEVPMLDPEFDEGEEVELPKEDKYTNDLDPQK